jgi:hypothetical protein
MDNIPVSICVDTVGNTYVAGFIRNFPNNFDIATIKYNQAGQEIWVKIFNGVSDSLDFPVQCNWIISVIFIFRNKFQQRL